MTSYEDRPWLKLYAAGVPANIDTDEFPTIVDLINESMAKYANRIAFTCFGRDLKYKELDKKSILFGQYLISRGLQPGDRVALMSPNILQYPIALLGCVRAGLIVVNTNPLYTPREMEHQFNDSGAKAILIADNFAGNLEKIISKTSIKVVITTSVGEMAGLLKGKMIDTVLKVKGSRPKFNIPNTVTFSQAIAGGKKFKLSEFTNEPDDVILLQYTGGTTGVAKGAMLTNKNLVSNMLMIRAILDAFLKSDEPKNALCPLPMYHIFAFTVHSLTMMALGHRNILIPNPRDLKSFTKEFNNYPIHLMTGVNTLFNALINNEGFTKLDFKNLLVTIGGGTAVQQAVAKKWQEVTGCQLTEGYGLTETSPVASVNPVDGRARLGMIGLPAPSTIMRVVNEAGQVLPPGEPGEIQIKGPQVMKGYYNRPDATAETIKDGWLCSGDIGLMHPDGFFQIVDRQKDMINVSGFNVYPNEIEEVVMECEKVLEVAAVGKEHAKSGECVVLYVVKKDNSLTKEELIKHCRENLTGYKIPKEVHFKEELPKTNVGKILRRLLKEEAAKG
ncbi:UNVERIFIED_CONTAM: hypothetical protein GTU68_039515 [Idotea baltica]|nr:hypothetical protein [Idotea baltica]